MNIAISAFGKKGTKLTKLDDFIPEWGGGRKKATQSLEDMRNTMMAFVSGSRKRKKE